jgi:putative endonuclease
MSGRAGIPVISPPEGRRAQGDAAEERACRHLEESGLTIVVRNYRTKGGEIDIVARKGEVLVFVEVRSLEASGFGTPEESITPAKRRRIVGAARHYLSTVPPSSWREARFDVIAIEGSGEAAVLRHFPAAFDAKGKVL